MDGATAWGTETDEATQQRLQRIEERCGQLERRVRLLETKNRSHRGASLVMSWLAPIGVAGVTGFLGMCAIEEATGFGVGLWLGGAGLLAALFSASSRPLWSRCARAVAALLAWGLAVAVGDQTPLVYIMAASPGLAAALLLVQLLSNSARRQWVGPDVEPPVVRRMSIAGLMFATTLAALVVFGFQTAVGDEVHLLAIVVPSGIALGLASWRSLCIASRDVGPLWALEILLLWCAWILASMVGVIGMGMLDEATVAAAFGLAFSPAAWLEAAEEAGVGIVIFATTGLTLLLGTLSIYKAAGYSLRTVGASQPNAGQPGEVDTNTPGPGYLAPSSAAR